MLNICPEKSYCRGDGTRTGCLEMAGQYCPREGMTTPENLCPEGHIWIAGSGCQPAEAGRYFDNTAREQFDRSVSQSSSECPPGTYNNRTGQTSCLQCDRGYSSTIEYDAIGRIFRKGCQVCGLGNYSDAGVCIACPRGKYGISGGRCTDCERGKYQDEVGKSSCKRCLGAEYNAYENQSVCQRFPFANVSVWKGSMSLKLKNERIMYRLDATLGYVGNEIQIVENYTYCPVKFYSCPCYYSIFPNDTEFKTCLDEYNCSLRISYRELFGYACLDCPRGFVCYNDTRGIVPKKVAVIGTTFYSGNEDMYGDPILNNCSNPFCGQGYFLSKKCDNNSDRVCSKCGYDKYKPFENYIDAECNESSDVVFGNCMNISYSERPGGVCNQCPRGSIKDTSKAFGCVKCPTNTTEFEGRCVPCAVGNTMSLEGSTMCSYICNSGFYSPSGLGAGCQNRSGVINQRPVIDGIFKHEVLFFCKIVGKEEFVVGVNYYPKGALMAYVNQSSIEIMNDKLFGEVSEFGQVNELSGGLGRYIFSLGKGIDGTYAIKQLELDESQHKIKSQKLLYTFFHTSEKMSMHVVSDENIFVIDYRQKAVYNVSNISKNIIVNNLGVLPFLKGPTKIVVRNNEFMIMDAFSIQVVNFSNSVFVSNKTLCGRSSASGMSGVTMFNQEGVVHCDMFLMEEAIGVRDIAWLSDNTVYFMKSRGQMTKVFYMQNRYMVQLNVVFREYSLSLGFVVENDRLFVVGQTLVSQLVDIIELSAKPGLCNAGMVYSSDMGQCVQTPVGTYARHWSSAPTLCPLHTYTLGAGSKSLADCISCPFIRRLGSMGTREEGALNCVEKCQPGIPFDHANQSCGEACKTYLGYYFDGEECTLCPLGTESVEGGSKEYDAAHSCTKCPVGKYGASPGICSTCADGFTTFFEGLTYCSPNSTLCAFDGLYGNGERCGPNTTIQRDVREKSSIKITSNGVMYIGNGSIILKSMIDKLSGALSWSVVGSVNGSGSGVNFVNKVLMNPYELIEVTNDEKMLFFTSYYSHCIWKVHLSENVSVYEEEGAWAGSCSDGFYEMNGNRYLARFGHIVDMVYLEVEGRTPLLIVSTVSLDGCANIRSVSMYDGSVSTFVSVNTLLFPTILGSVCTTGHPFKLSVARGSDILYYSRGRTVQRVGMYTDSYETDDVALNLGEGNRPLSMCGIRNRIFMFVAVNNLDHISMFDLQSREYVTHMEIKNFSSNLHCLGQHVWYRNIMGEIIELSRPVYNSRVECIAGYMHTQVNDVCYPVGVGSYRDIEYDDRSLCPAGTFNLDIAGGDVSKCMACPKNSISKDNSIACSECRLSRAVEGKSCENSCKLGYYYDNDENCVACPSGKTSLASNSVGVESCQACPENEFSNALTNFTCEKCPHGKVSLRGSVDCVIQCNASQCSTNGITCSTIAMNFEVITSLRSNEKINALVAVSGQGLLFTNNHNIAYMKDNCPSYVSLDEARTCIPEIQQILNACEGTCDPRGRWFTAMVMSNEDLSQITLKTKYLYVASKSLYKIYRFPIVFKNGEVDVVATQFLLKEGNGGLSGIEQWAFVGNGEQGYRDGNAFEAKFSVIADLEVSTGDKLLYVSDFSNNRIRVIHLDSMQVFTIMGNGNGCWQKGYLGVPGNTSRYSCAIPPSHGYALAHLPNGMELDENDDLFVAMTYESKIGRLNYVKYMNDLTERFDYYCSMIISDGKMNGTVGMTCKTEKPPLYRSCFLNKVYDLVSYNHFLLAAVLDGIMVINKLDQNCSRVGGLDWKYTASGWEDGQNGTSRFNQPFRLTMSKERGILYIDDYNNKAIRRIYVNGKCSCPPGMLFVESGKSCYNPAITKSRKMLVSCAEGYFSIENENICRDCKEAVYLNMKVPQCELWKQSNLIKNTKLSYSEIPESYSSGQGGREADYYGGPSRPENLAWDAFFSTTKDIVGYKRGLVSGYAPSGKVFYSVTYDLESSRWKLTEDPEKAPVVIIPGIWYPCNVQTLTTSSTQCTCLWHVGEFDPPGRTNCMEKPSWGCLRLAAVDFEARLIEDSNTDLWKLVKSDTWKTKFQGWSKYYIFGTDVSQRQIEGCEEGGPCFSSFNHRPALMVSGIPDYNNRPTGHDDFTMSVESGLFDKTADMKCAVGWPMHSYCSNGYMWVGAHHSGLVKNLGIGSKTLACISCLPGTFSSIPLIERQLKGGPYKCLKCPGGKYSDTVGASTCVECPLNTYSSLINGASSCTTCPQNHYSERGSSILQACTPCIPGTGMCDDCPAGYYQSRAGQSTCIACSPGYISTRLRSEQCEACLLDTYQPQSGRQTCIECEKGSFTRTTGSSACMTCASNLTCKLFVNRECGRGCGLNYFWNPDSKECVRCASGSLNAFLPCAIGFSACTYGNENRSMYVSSFGAPENGGDVISFCPRGKQATNTFYQCEDCGVGYYGVENNGCQPCPPGTFSDVLGATICLHCPRGKFNNVNGKSACMDCSRGSYAGTEGHAFCLNCSMGTYADVEGSERCSLCPNGTFSNITGRRTICDDACDPTEKLFSGSGATVCSYCSDGVVTFLSTCIGCGLGMYVDGAICKNCPAGTFNNYTHHGVGLGSTCINCSATQYSSEGALECFNVRVGYEVSRNKSTEVACEMGYFRGDGNSSCVECGTGSYTANRASVECVLCAPGFFQNSKGQKWCSRCASGFYAKGFGNPICVSCGVGMIPNLNQTDCEYCPRNRYKDGLRFCSRCPVGTVSPEGSGGVENCNVCPDNLVLLDSENCVPCPSGTFKNLYDYSGARGLYRCETCPEGTHNPLEGAVSIGSCVPCEITGYVPSSNRSLCVKCLPGQSGNGVSCSSCPRGKYSSEGLVCVDCPFGFYNNDTGQSTCLPCAPGTFTNDTMSTNCSMCPVGTYQSRNGSNWCSKCTSFLGFSNTTGLRECLPRRESCNVGQYVKYNFDQPEKDHDCVACGFCRAGQFLVIENLVRFLDLSEINDEDSVNLYCPGNTSRPLFSCVENEAAAGTRLYVDSTAMNAGSIQDATGSFGIQVGIVPCLDIENMQDPELVEYVGYVKGPDSRQCYVGCKFEMNQNGLLEYLQTYGTSASENPQSNVFHTRMLGMSKRVCNRCPLTACPMGYFRPQWDNISCGPPCMFERGKECPLNGDMSGCTRPCNKQPINSIVIGGSRELNVPTCAWQCQLRYFLNENSSGCLSCENDTLCASGFIAVDISECMPYHKRSDLCKQCEAMDGGSPIAWDKVRNKCVYRCFSGYYGKDGSTQCVPCRTNITDQRCPSGEYRDIDICLDRGVEPPCKPCFADVASRSVISFHTDGGYSAMECIATCNAGYNAYFIRNNSLVPILKTKTLSHEIRCQVCVVGSDTACQGVCAGGQFRNLSASDDRSCVKCRTSYSCQAGFYADYCDGNGTSDAVCLPCSKSYLNNSDSIMEVRVFIPNNAPNRGKCPTSCIVNHVEHQGKCIPCSEYVRTVRGCLSETMPSNYYGAGDPRPCDFVYSHWNASDDVVWWNAKYTPMFMRNWIGSGGIQQRKDICWACPPGRGTFIGDSDLCEVLPGYGRIPNEEVRKTSLSVDPKTFHLLTTDIRQPSRRVVQARRRLLQVNTLNPVSTGLALIQKCKVGFYKSSRDEGSCSPCPPGTSTFVEGSTSLSACRCLYGYRRQLEVIFGNAYNATNVSLAIRMQLNSSFLSGIPCVPCVRNTFRALKTIDENECTLCPEYETTFGKVNATSCGCSHGYFRTSSGVCSLCPANHFCVPCSDDDLVCPSGKHSFVESCYPNSTSLPGSHSVDNCTCMEGTFALERNKALRMSGLETMVEYERKVKANLYCLSAPPYAVYNKKLKLIECRKGWNALWDNGRLVGCILCGPGQYSVRDPSIPFLRNGVEVYDPVDCRMCPTGKFSTSSVVIGNCESCPFKLTTKRNGSRSIDECGCPGSKVLSTNKTVCVGCMQNEYFANETCWPCPLYATVDAKIEMASRKEDCICERGRYLLDGKLCIECPLGTYSAFAGNAPCRKCPLGSTTAQVGSTSKNDCIICTSGYRLVPQLRQCINSSIPFL